jgi:hypothetical protein
MLAIQGHERRHFEDDAGIHCAIVRTLGETPQVLYDSLITLSASLIEAQEAEAVRKAEVDAATEGKQLKLERLREKRTRGEDLTAEEVQVVLDYILGV